MGKDIPQKALMNIARAVADEEGINLNQRHLNEADRYIQAVLCDKEDCFLLAGHDSPCSFALLEAFRHNQTLRATLESLLGMVPDGPLRSASEEILESTTIY